MNTWLVMAVLIAAPESETVTARPYDVAICLRMTDSPQLTPLLRDTLRRQVEGQLSSFFGNLADVAVLTEGHWLIHEYPGRDVSEPPVDDALWDRLPHEKTVIARLDYRDDSYHVDWRELDRERRLDTPVQHSSTPDRQWLAKAVCVAAQQHLSLVATVTPGTFKKTVAIEIHGAAQRGQINAMLEDSALFQPYWVMRQRNGVSRRFPIPNTLLRVRPQDSVFKADVLSNLAEPWRRNASVIGFEAVKISTQAGQIRLHLVDEATGDPVRQCSVFVNDKGFEDFTASDNLGSPDREGYVLIPRTFRDVVFVKIAQGSTAVLQLPIPITSGFSEQLVKVPVANAPGKRMEFDRRMRFVLQDVQTIAAMQAEAARDVNELNGNKRYEEALTRAAQTHAGVNPLLADSRSRLQELQKAAEEMQLNDARVPLLVSQIEQLASQHGDLGRTAANLKQAIETRDANSRAQVLFDLAKQAEQQGDIDEALKNYHLGLKESDQAPVRQHVATMERLWDVSDSPARQQAHRLIYDQWTNAELTELESLFPEVKRALETLKSEGDYLRAWRLFQSTGKHIGDLEEVNGQLAARADEEGNDELERYKKLTQDMASFLEDVSNFARTASKNQPAPNAPVNAPSVPATPDEPNGDAGATEPRATRPPKPEVEEEEEPTS